MTQAPAGFDVLVGEDGLAFVLEKIVTLADPGVAEQRVTPAGPHHLHGELTIALTGQADVIASGDLPMPHLVELLEEIR